MNRLHRNLLFLALLSFKLIRASESESEKEDDLPDLADFDDVMVIPNDQFSNYETDAGEGSSGNFYRSAPHQIRDGILPQDILSHSNSTTASTTNATPSAIHGKRGLNDYRDRFFDEEPPKFHEERPRMPPKKAKKPSSLTRRNLSTVVTMGMPEIPPVNIALVAPVPRPATTDHSDNDGGNTPGSATSEVSRTGSTYSGYDSTELLMRAPHGDSDLEPKGSSEYGSDSENERRRKRRLISNFEK